MESISLGDMVAVLSFFGAVLFFIIKSFTKPLQDLLQRTIQALNRLSDLLTEEQNHRQALEIRMQRVEDRCKSNGHRLDRLEEQQKRCISKSLVN